MTRDLITVSSVASPEPQTVTIDSDSNEPTFPYRFGNQHPFMPPSFNDPNLPHNPFTVLATMAVNRQDGEDSPQSPEPSDLSPISTIPMNLSTIEGWETLTTTLDDNTIYSEGKPRRVCWDITPNETFDSNEPKQVSFASIPSSTSPPPRRQKKLSMGMSFPQKGGVKQHTCEACGQPLSAKRKT